MFALFVIKSSVHATLTFPAWSLSGDICLYLPLDLDARLNASYQAMRNPGFAPSKFEENMTLMAFA